jgi:Uma2 family endonuclease
MRVMRPPYAITAEQLAAIDDPPWQHELLRRQLRTMSPPGFEHGAVCTRIASLLDAHVRRQRSGRVVGNGVGFVLARGPDTVLGPDVGFVARARMPGSRVRGYFEGPPDLAIEVRSQHDSRPAQLRKAAEWLHYGTRSVWLVDPERRTVTVLDASGSSRELAGDTVLEDPVVPGSRVAVADLFDFDED